MRKLAMLQKSFVLIGLVLCFLFVTTAWGEGELYTNWGRIIWTQGHEHESCRMVAFQENGSPYYLIFRISNQKDDLGSKDSVGSVVLSALLTDREVYIAYAPGVTSGCGAEPRISHITIK